MDDSLDVFLCLSLLVVGEYFADCGLSYRLRAVRDPFVLVAAALSPPSSVLAFSIFGLFRGNFLGWGALFLAYALCSLFLLLFVLFLIL